jgi:hypothetical protein
MFKLDNITLGTWKPHFFDEDSFVEMFKLDNIYYKKPAFLVLFSKDMSCFVVHQYVWQLTH